MLDENERIEIATFNNILNERLGVEIAMIHNSLIGDDAIEKINAIYAIYDVRFIVDSFFDAKNGNRKFFFTIKLNSKKQPVVKLYYNKRLIKKIVNCRDTREVTNKIVNVVKVLTE